MTRDELLADVAYARSLAEEGRHAPLLGGSYLVFWGLLNAAAFAVQYGVLEGYLPFMDGMSFAVLWLSYAALAGLGMALLGARKRAKPGVASIGARAERALWSGAGLAAVVFAVGSITRMILNQDVTAPNAILGAAFALYGLALFGTAALAQQSWLRPFALLSIAVAGVLCAFANENWVYLAAAAGSLLVLVCPGLILLKHEPGPVAG